MPNHESRAHSGPQRRRPRRTAPRGVFSRAALPLGRIFGIRIAVDYSWFIIFALLTWSLATVYYPGELPQAGAGLHWLMGAVTALLLFASVLLHELGHSVIALEYGMPVRGITLFIFGGVAQLGAEPPRPTAELLIAIGGPIVSAALAGLFYLASTASEGTSLLFWLGRYLAVINASLVIFNLIPGFPLDGGRVLRGIVWAINRNFARATTIAASVGRFFAFAFIGLGLWQLLAGDVGDGLWLAFIGWFLDSAAVAQLRQVKLRVALAGHTVAEVMNTNCPRVPPTLTVRELIEEYVRPTGQRCFLVRDGDSGMPGAGLVTLWRVKRLLREGAGMRTVADVMLPFKRLHPVRPDAELWSALQQMDREGAHHLPVCEGRELVGVLSRQEVMNRLRLWHELGVLSGPGRER